MNPNALYDGLIGYLIFLIVLTFHEAGHAWMSWKRGDDTARLLGRITLNPLAHMDLLGTVILPLLGVFLGAAGSGAARFIIGWGKPVPVNPANLKNPQFDGMLIALAGPLMNVLVAMVAMMIVRGGHLGAQNWIMELGVQTAIISMFLCFFNLLPIPPLDGSHVLRYVANWSDETYHAFAQYGFLAVIIVIQLDVVNQFLAFLTVRSVSVMAMLVGLGNRFI
jgi:Zn-dependent protease